MNNNLKTVDVIGTVGVPACYGGFESLVENIIEDQDIKYRVYCSSKVYDEKLPTYKDAELVYLPFHANGAQSIIYDITSLIGSIRSNASTVLILGVSGCLFLPVFRLFSRAKVVTNIDGLEWKRDKWGKLARIFLKFSERAAVRYSDIVVSDNVAIADYVREEYGVESQVIAYGGDHAVVDGVGDSDFLDPFALGLCRIEPENNVHLILEAFAQNRLHLKFVGNWGASNYGIMLKEKYSQYPNITILDPIYDLSKLSVLRNACALYIHGHSAGGTNPSLVEMMHFAKPIACFDCNYNRATTEGKAMYFKNVDELVSLIDKFDPKGHAVKIANKMLEIAKRRYTWSIVKKQYSDLFK